MKRGRASALLLLPLLLCVFLPATAPARAESWVLAIHGGAGVIDRGRLTPEREQAVRAALARALEAGGAILRAGGSAVDAVEAAIRLLEDDPHFNAGRGAVFTDAETIELDASIMDGRERRAGAVAGVTRTRNPISLARAVMTDNRHVMLAGPGADAFARERGLEQVDPSWFRTEERLRQLRDSANRGQGARLMSGDRKYGTVGAVARDRAGHLAAGTSTGGLTGKRHGRIGDSPVIGAGTYADDRACAVSATGAGEYYIREGVAHQICARMRLLGEPAQVAADMVQAETRALGGAGGVIVLDTRGNAVWSFNTPGMYRARIGDGSAPEVAIYADED